MKTPRFSVRAILVAMALLALALALIPMIYQEILWAPQRRTLRQWAPTLVQPSDSGYSHGIHVSGRTYFIMTQPSYIVAHGSMVVCYDFPENSGIAEQSPYGPDKGFFITPQCVWVETVDDAVARWKKTTRKDWNRYETMSPNNRPLSTK